jgi:hypothetical protein
MPIISPDHPERFSLEQPALGDLLWRYMDFTKFVSMLVNEGLYLSRMDRLGDEYEGWIPEPKPKPNPGFFGESDMTRQKELRLQWQQYRKRLYVSCWHANDVQSDAMWKLYSKGIGGVAIRTTCRKLKASLEKTKKKLWLYEVVYDDIEKSRYYITSPFRACMTKRKPFEHEKEVRLLWYDSESSEQCGKNAKFSGGFFVECNLSILIEKIIISPNEKTWFVKIVEDVLKKYGVKKDVEPSDLYQKPP